MTAAELKALEGKGELLESAKVFDHIYATPKSFVVKHLQNGNNVLLAIDVQGTKKIRKVLESEYRLCTIFVLPPSIKVLRERLEGRQTEAPEEIQRRIEVAQDEIKEAGLYDFTVVNQNLDQTVQEIEADIEKFDQERRN